jgi:hypothetical protein
MHASNRLIETSWRTAKIVVKAPENGCSLSRRADPHAILKIAGLLARRPHRMSEHGAPPIGIHCISRVHAVADVRLTWRYGRREFV